MCNEALFRFGEWDSNQRDGDQKLGALAAQPSRHFQNFNSVILTIVMHSNICKNSKNTHALINAHPPFLTTKMNIFLMIIFKISVFIKSAL